MKPAEVLFLRQPWLITPEAHAALLSAAQSSFAAALHDLDEPETSPLLDVQGKIGLITISGPMMRRPGLFAQLFFGATDTDAIIEAVQEARARPDIALVLLDIDSPGGSVNGTPELAQAVADLASRKYTYAFTAGQMCSAAYWVGSQCDGVYMTPSARVGSIGVILPVHDTSEAYREAGVKVEVFAAGKYKSTGTPGVPLTDDQRAWLQQDVEEIAAEFHRAVLARGRKIPAEAMEGQSFFARKAEQFHLATAVRSRADLLALLRNRHLR